MSREATDPVPRLVGDNQQLPGKAGTHNRSWQWRGMGDILFMIIAVKNMIKIPLSPYFC